MCWARSGTAGWWVVQRSGSCPCWRVGRAGEAARSTVEPVASVPCVAARHARRQRCSPSGQMLAHTHVAGGRTRGTCAAARPAQAGHAGLAACTTQRARRTGGVVQPPGAWRGHAGGTTAGVAPATVVGHPAATRCTPHHGAGVAGRPTTGVPWARKRTPARRVCQVHRVRSSACQQPTAQVSRAARNPAVDALHWLVLSSAKLGWADPSCPRVVRTLRVAGRTQAVGSLPWGRCRWAVVLPFARWELWSTQHL